jgi:hypothetical protein
MNKFLFIPFYSFLFLFNTTSFSQTLNLKLWGVIPDNDQATVDEANSNFDTNIAMIDKAFNSGGISFNYCTELIVDQNLYSNPENFTFCESLHEPGWLNLLINANPALGGAGEGCDIGAPCGWSDEIGTAVHELGHMLNLFHTFEGDQCTEDIPVDYNSGGSLSKTGTGDFVGDTPVHQNVRDGGLDNINLPLSSICFIDWENSYCDYTQDNNGNITPTVYYPADYCTEGGSQVTILEDNPLSYMFGCNPNDPKFTTGQFDRMKAYINSNYGDLQDPNMPCNSADSPQLLNNSLIAGGANLTGIYIVTETININSDVTITDAVIRVPSSFAFNIKSNGSLTCSNVRFIKSCTSVSGLDGLIAESGSELSLEAVTIESFNVGLRLNTQNVVLNTVKFINCGGAGLIVNDVSPGVPITAIDVYSHQSEMFLNNSRVMLMGCMFYDSNLKVTGGDVWIDKQMARSRPSFFDSSIDFTGGFFGVNYAYFNNGSLIKVDISSLTQICWSYLENGSNMPKIDLGSVGTYNIVGNIFDLGSNYLNAKVTSDGSWVSNNIFKDGATDFISDDIDVEISCNHHDNSALPYTTPTGFKDQGKLDNPAGNIFNTTIDNDVSAASPFLYRYDQDNINLERPKLSNPSSLFRTGIQASRDCLPRDSIFATGLWDDFDPYSDCYLEFINGDLSPWWNCGCPPPPPPPMVFPIGEDVECINCPTCVGCPDCTICPECPGCFDSEDKGGHQDGRNIDSSQIFASSTNSSYQNQEVYNGDIIDITLVSDQLFVRSDLILNDYKANLYNVTGQKITEYKLNGRTNTFDFNTMPEGIYFILVVDENKMLIKNQVIFQSK